MSLSAGRDLTVRGSDVVADEELNVDAARDVRVLAGKNLTLIAEGGGEDSDIRVRGSELKAVHAVRLKAQDQVDLRAAGNTVKERTDSENQSASIGIGCQFGSSEVGWGIVASATDIHSEFTSVAEQSGIHAGDGGFDVRVQSKTRLKGGAITSTQPAGEQGRPRLRVGGACLSEAAGRASTLKPSSSRRRLATVSSQPVPRTCPGTANDTP